MFKVGLLLFALSASALPASAQITVKEAKDQGRTNIIFSGSNMPAGPTTVEVGTTIVKSGGTTATTSAASFTCTAGKTFRINEISVASKGNATGTVQVSDFSLRYNASGAVTTSSTPVIFKASSATPATGGAWDRFTFPIPDGYEIKCDGVGQFGVTAQSTYVTNAPTWYLNISGFEY